MRIKRLICWFVGHNFSAEHEKILQPLETLRVVFSIRDCSRCDEISPRLRSVSGNLPVGNRDVLSMLMNMNLQSQLENRPHRMDFKNSKPLPTES